MCLRVYLASDVTVSLDRQSMRRGDQTILSGCQLLAKNLNIDILPPVTRPHKRKRFFDEEDKEAEDADVIYSTDISTSLGGEIISLKDIHPANCKPGKERFAAT